MTKIIDKRFLPKNATTGSRKKFIDRYKDVIKQRVKEIVTKGNLKDTLKGDKKVKIRADDLNEPGFELEPGTGNTDRVYIGNKQFHKGQRVKRPQKNGGGSKNGGGNGGEGEDDFEFVLTEEEFAQLFFEDLELPDETKKEFLGSIFEIQHAGYSRSGGPTSLNVKKTMLHALGRRAATEQVLIEQGIIGKELEDKLNEIPLVDDIDLRYNFKDKVDVPTSKCVMFCLMDVSGSMGEREKDIAKRFFLLLNLFLKRSYKEVDVIFVRHADLADEVDEDTFYHDRKSGGTVMSSGYEKIAEILKSRYNVEQVNVYIAQASDGDNFDFDNELMEQLLVERLLPQTQYFAYIDIPSVYSMMDGAGESSAMTIMKRLMRGHSNLQAREVTNLSQIWTVFRSLFEKKKK